VFLVHAVTTIHDGLPDEEMKNPGMKFIMLQVYALAVGGVLVAAHVQVKNRCKKDLLGSLFDQKIE
jgi:hypothetical protein